MSLISINVLNKIAEVETFIPFGNGRGIRQEIRIKYALN